MTIVALEIAYTGAVQGVGFRPHVARVAQRHRVTGWVRNLGGEVRVFVEGTDAAIRRFMDDVEGLAESPGRPRRTSERPRSPRQWTTFSILPSRRDDGRRVDVPLDRDWCEACAREHADPTDRRHGDPFISCALCGPRYSILGALPWDRANTSMSAFEPCPACRTEYESPDDRRFHAESVSCPRCGPRAWFDDARTDGTAAALDAAAEAIRDGRIVAVRGVGGYHFLCDAGDPGAVRALRTRKHRPARPFAVMFPEFGLDGLDCVRGAVELSPVAERALLHPARPIVLVPHRGNGEIDDGVAPGVPDLGVMLPPSPLHRSLLARVGRPVVATSGNVSGAPIEHEAASAGRRLRPVADHFLHHDREIAHPVEDSVQRFIAGKARRLRAGRGVAPACRSLPFRLEEPTLALGGHLKSTVTLGWDNRAASSPHIGDLESADARARFASTIEIVQELFGVRALRWVGDAHPDYASRRWATGAGHAVATVWHHHAHASALALEADQWQDLLVFTWDGAGLGPGNELWGGEAFHGGPGHWERVAHFRPFHLVGGEHVGREPWRSAAALCWATRSAWAPLNTLDPEGVVARAWVRDGLRQTTTAAGRVFDAAAALILGCHHTSYEAEAGLRLEALATHADVSGPEFPVTAAANGVHEIDWSPWVPFLADHRRSPRTRSCALHTALARVVASLASRIARERPVRLVGLTGGVFQNRALAEQTLDALGNAGLPAFLPAVHPCNDGALSLGQLVEIGCR